MIRAEAETLFRRVRAPNAMESKLLELLGSVALVPRSETEPSIVKYLEFKKEVGDETEKGKAESNGNDVGKGQETELNPQTE